MMLFLPPWVEQAALSLLVPPALAQAEGARDGLALARLWSQQQEWRIDCSSRR